MIKDKKMNYFVIDFKKIENAEAYKNVIVGHNFRQRTYKQTRTIILTQKGLKIILFYLHSCLGVKEN